MNDAGELATAIRAWADANAAHIVPASITVGDRSSTPCVSLSPPEEELPEAKPAFTGIDAPRGEADDLKRLPGVNGNLEQRLNDSGVYHYWQIADLDAEATAALDGALNLKGRIARDGWVAAAKKLVEQEAA
jgi:small subunit ribosomal protein S2